MNFTLTDRILKQAEKTVNILKSFGYFKYFQKYSGYYKDFKRYLKGLSDLRFASYSYIPLLGWIIPLTLRKNNSFCVHHAKQGFVLFVLFVTAAIVLNLINIFMPVEWRVFRLILVIGIYLFYIAYLVFCIIAIDLSSKGKAFNIRIVKRFTDAIEL